MLSGECFCGSVRYEIDGELQAMYCCHCSRCRKMSGASCTTNAIINSDSFRITHGVDKLTIVQNGEHNRHHCSICHGWLYVSSAAYEGVIFVPCGTLNEAPNKKIDYHVHVDSKAAWTEISDGKPQFPGALPSEYISGTESS